MNFGLSTEQALMRDSVRRLVQREIEPLLQSHDASSALPKAAFQNALRALATLGLTCARLPASAGGPGIGMVDYGVTVEQLPPAIAVGLIAHEASTARLYAEANDEQRNRLVPDFAAANRIFCTGSTEPDTGSDPRGVRTRLTRRGEGLVLNGRKMWISNVAECDAILVTCLDCRNDPRGTEVIKVVLERERSPFEARNLDMIGLKQGLLGEAVFEDTPVDARNVVAGGAGGTEVLKTSWAVNRPLFGLIAVHLAERAFEIAVDYARIRSQFGKPIGAHQLVQKNLSDIETAVSASRLLCYQALWLADTGAVTDGAAAMAKRYAQNACSEAVWQAMNVLGAMGLATEARLEGLYRDVRMLAVPDGTNEILALIHGREITGFEAFRGNVRSSHDANATTRSGGSSG